jgi:hypothetical protein
MNQRHTHKYALIYPIQYAIYNDQNIRELEFMYGKYKHYREVQTMQERAYHSFILNPTLSILARQIIIEPQRTQTPAKTIRCAKPP